MVTTHLLYLHGFRSSPQSTKARQVASWLQTHRPDLHFWAPALPPDPDQALALVLDGTSAWPARQMGVIGSSLGGFLASLVAEARGCRAVVINPAIDPARDLSAYIGEQACWHEPQLKFDFTAAHVAALRRMTPSHLTAMERYAALIAKGDEVLDWREMSARYAGSRIRLLEGGDHALSDFDDHLPFVMGFLEISPCV